jgi:hypothetical protein
VPEKDGAWGWEKIAERSNGDETRVWKKNKKTRREHK